MINPSHKVYIDDSGTKEYHPDKQYGKNNTRYFVFGAIIIDVANQSILHEKMLNQKTRLLGNEKVEIKSNWLRMPNERRRRYLDRYNISENNLTDYVDELYEIINESPFVFVAAVIDKLHMQEDYSPNPWYPPAVAYELVLQRVQSHMEQTGGYAHITIDDMTGATPKRNQYKSNLERQHQQLQLYGSKLKKGFSFPNIIGKIKFMDSSLSNMIQVADICSYNVLRQFVEHGEEWEQENPELELYSYLRRIEAKFRQDPNGRVQGYGIVKFPLRRRVRWHVSSK